MKLPLITPDTSAQQRWAQLGQRLLDDVPGVLEYDHSITLTACERYLMLFSGSGYWPASDIAWASDRTTAAEQLALFPFTLTRLCRAWDVETGAESVLAVRARYSEPRPLPWTVGELQAAGERALRMADRHLPQLRAQLKKGGGAKLTGRFLLVHQELQTEPLSEPTPHEAPVLRFCSIPDLRALELALEDRIYSPSAALALWDLGSEDPAAHRRLDLWLNVDYQGVREEVPLHWPA